MYIIICETDHQSRFDACDRVLRAGALGWPRGMGWWGRWEGGSGWGTHVHPWLIHVKKQNCRCFTYFDSRNSVFPSLSSFCSPWMDKWCPSNILSPASISRFSLEFLSVCCIFPQRFHNHYLKLNILCPKSITLIWDPRMDYPFSAYDALMFQVYRYLINKQSLQKHLK